MIRKEILIILAVVLFVTQVCCYGGPIIYVDKDANGYNDGASWENAYPFLQDALVDANSGDKPVEIRVAQGMYRPDRSSTEPNGTGDREATFQLINGVSLKGGYAGFSTPDPNARDIGQYETILSGDLNSDDAPNFANNGENSYHVVTGSGTDETAVLDGFTITAGNANGKDGPPDYFNCGGGIFNGFNYARPTLINCMFGGNSAEYGGAILGAFSKIVNCTIKHNSARIGGGISSCWGSITDCIISHNWADRGGGVGDCECLLTNCTISGNSAISDGGGIWCYERDLTVTNCTISGNTAKDKGGGIYFYFYGSIGQTVSNCTIIGNLALEGGCIYGSGSTTTVSNCILWGNTAPTGPQVRRIGSVVYTDVQGGWGGLGNIDAEPMFVDLGRWVDANDPNIIVEPSDPNAAWIDGDYHLKSEGWRWDTKRKVWTWDDVTSPCIDAGNPGCALGDELLSVPDDPNNVWGENLRINMGAYGGTAEASMALPGWALLADLTNDRRVDFNDLEVFVEYWLDIGLCIPGDLNRNESVDFSDFGIMGFDWLEER